MKKIFPASLLLFLPFFAFAQNSIEGVWSHMPDPRMSGASIRDFSWGRRIIPRGYDFIIDLHSDPPIFQQANMIPDRIVGIEEKDNSVELTISALEGKNDSFTLVFNFTEEGTMLAEPSNRTDAFLGYRMEVTYYKIDGPEFDPETEKTKRALRFEKTHTTASDLTLYEMDDANSAVIMTLPANSNVQLLDVHPPWFSPVIIDGVTVRWARVTTADGTIGWLLSDIFVLPEEEESEENPDAESPTVNPENQTAGEESKLEHPPLFFLLMPLALLAALVLLLVLIIRIIDRTRKKR